MACQCVHKHLEVIPVDIHSSIVTVVHRCQVNLKSTHILVTVTFLINEWIVDHRDAFGEKETDN